MGNLEYFNSLGAGISFSWGTIHMESKTDSKLTDAFSSEKTVTMKNIVGISTGILFSKSDSIGGSRLIFAPTVNLQVLDFQVGFGYELGSVSKSTQRCIITVSYGIPITKFTDSGSYLLRRKIKGPDKNSSQTIQGFF